MTATRKRSFVPRSAWTRAQAPQAIIGRSPRVDRNRRAFPDVHVTIEDQIAERDKVVTRFIFHGTRQGEFLGVAATGKVVTWTGITITRLTGGKDVEDWESFDALGLMQQLGVIPQMAQGGA